MGWGRIYEVPASAEVQLRECRSKSQWYEAMNGVVTEDAPQLDAADSIRVWASKLHDLGHPFSTFFEGDLHADYDEYDDPNVCFVGPELAKAFLAQLDQVGKQFFIDLFPRSGPIGEGDVWLYEPLRDFLGSLSERGGAAIILWEN